MSNEFGFKACTKMAVPKFNMWDAAKAFGFYCLVGLFFLMCAQVVWAVISVVMLFV